MLQKLLLCQLDSWMTAELENFVLQTKGHMLHISHAILQTRQELPVQELRLTKNHCIMISMLVIIYNIEVDNWEKMEQDCLSFLYPATYHNMLSWKIILIENKNYVNE